MSTTDPSAHPIPTSAVTPPRAGVVAVVGRANAGKSTLVNRLVGEKVSIVSPVAQTTRSLVRGIVTDPRGQLALLDTPGLHRAESELGRMMNRLARGAIANVDLILLVLDASAPPHEEDEGWMRRLLFSDTPCLIALNKCDRYGFDAAPFQRCWSEIQAEKERLRPIDWISVSAGNGEGLDSLKTHLFASVPEGDPLFPADTVTDYPRKLAIADVVREKCFQFLRDELPHCLGVCVEEIVETDRQWRIAVALYVTRSSQKPILIGPKGRMLRRIRRQAEPEISAMFDVEASLDLWVKVDRHWDRNFWLLQSMGIAMG